MPRFTAAIVSPARWITPGDGQPLRAQPSFAGLVLTEVNPTHDVDGSLLRRYVDGVARALAA
jgi:hypothetical protein